MSVEWNKVTWYSKALALVVFIALPFLGFYFGVQYGRLLVAGSEPSGSRDLIYVSSVADDGSDYGSVHITMSDGKMITPENDAEDQVGASSPAIASDRRTVGWLVFYPGNIAGQSYPWPGRLVIYRDGGVIQEISPSQIGVIWDWKFIDGGNEVAMVSGPAHGTDIGKYELYDVASGKLLSSLTDPLNDGSPQWAKDIDAR
jgi:hypothetical protein